MDRKHPLELSFSNPGSLGKEKASTSSMRSGHGLDASGTARNQREKMSELYAALKTLLPNLFPRATRARIIDEAFEYIKVLKHKVTVLEASKATATQQASQQTPAFRAESSSRVEVSLSGNTAFFGIRFMAQQGLVTRVLEVFHRHNTTVMAATVTCNNGVAIVTVTSVVVDQDIVDRIQAEILRI